MSWLRRKFASRLWLGVAHAMSIVVVAGLFIYLGEEEAAARPERFAGQLVLSQVKNQQGQMADLEGGTDWLNASKAINIEDLRGRVVLLDFWTLC